MDNDLIATGQISDEFTLMSLFFRADLVVKLVIIILFSASIFSWTIIIYKIRLFKSLAKLSKSFEEIFWSGKSLKSISIDASGLSDSPLRAVFLDAIEEVEKSKTISTKNHEGISMSFKCGVCGSSLYDTIGSQSDRIHSKRADLYTLVMCKSCGLVQLKQYPSTEELSRSYQAGYSFYKPARSKLIISFVSLLLKTRLFDFFKLPLPLLRRALLLLKPAIKDPIFEYLAKDMSFLDFGCGYGNNCHFWGQRTALENLKRLGFDEKS